MKIIVISPLDVLLPDEKTVIEQMYGKQQRIRLRNENFADVRQFAEFIREHHEDFVCLVIRGNNKWYQEAEAELEQMQGLMFGILNYTDLSICFKQFFCGGEKGELCQKKEVWLMPRSATVFREEKIIEDGGYAYQTVDLDRAPFN